MLDYVDIGDMTISFIYLAIVVWDFKLAVWVYDAIINEFFSKNETMLHEIFKYIHKVMENTIYGWVSGIKDIIFALISGIIPMMP